MKKLFVLMLIVFVAVKVTGQIEVEAHAGIGYTGIDLESWYGGGVNDWFTMMGEAYVTVYPLHFGSLSVGGEVGFQHFFWYSVPVYGYSWSYEYTAEAIRVMGLIRTKVMDNGFAEVGPGAFIFWDWAALGVMASGGYRINISDNLAIPVKFRAEFVAVRDASPVVVGLSAGISYTF